MESKPAAVVFPSRTTGGGDKQALQRIHDRNLVCVVLVVDWLTLL